MNWMDEVVTALKQSSVKGVTRLCKARAVHLKLLWASAIFVFLTTGFYQSYELLTEYFSYPKLTLVKERQFSEKEDHVFPTIQVCNVNDNGLLKNMPKNESVEYYDSLVSNAVKCNNCSSGEQKLLSRLKQELNSVYGYITFIGINRTLGLLKDYRDFMVECLAFPLGQFTGTKCEELTTVTKYLSFGRLLCLRLKFPRDVLVSQVTMTFYIDSFETDPMEYNSENKWVSQSKGVVYSILYSDAKNVPSIVQPTAPPGVLTKVLIRKQRHERLPEPHGDCVPSAYNYTFADCRVRCIRKSFPKFCNCVSPADYEPEPDLPYCVSATLPQADMLKYYGCAGKAFGTISDECAASCVQHCSETRFRTEVSHSKWPLPDQYMSFYNKLLKHKPYSSKIQHMSSNHSKDMGEMEKQLHSLLRRQLVEDNFVKINFVLSNEAYQEFVEVPKYSVSSLIGSLGGTLNLWTGITAIVVIEILETLIKIINKSTSQRQATKPTLDNTTNHI